MASTSKTPTVSHAETPTVSTAATPPTSTTTERGSQPIISVYDASSADVLQCRPSNQQDRDCIVKWAIENESWEPEHEERERERQKIKSSQCTCPPAASPAEPPVQFEYYQDEYIPGYGYYSPDD